MKETDVPQAPESEETIVVAMLEPGAAERLMPAARGFLPDATAFHDPSLAEIYAAECALFDRGLDTAKWTVVEELRRRGTLELAGCPQAVASDTTTSADPATIRFHAHEVREAFRKRQLLRLGIETARSARNGVPASEVVATIKSRVDAIEPVAVVDSWTPVSQTEIHARGVQPTTWDVEELLERDSGPAILFGEPGTYKSWLSLHICACMVTGEPVFEHFKTTPRPRGGYVNLDAGARAFARRAAMLGRAIDQLWIISPDEFDPDRFRGVLKANAGAFIVADTFADMYAPDPRAEQGAEMRGFLRSLRRAFEETGCSGLLLDHTNRSNLATSERYYGSVQKKGSIRQMIAVETIRLPEERHGRARVKLTCAKMSEAEQFAAFLVDLEWSDATFRAVYAGPADDAVSRAAIAVKDAEIVIAALTKHAAPMSGRELEDACNLSRDRVRAVLKSDQRIGTLGPARSPKRRYVVRSMITELDLDGGDGE